MNDTFKDLFSYTYPNQLCIPLTVAVIVKRCLGFLMATINLSMNEDGMDLLLIAD